MEAASDVNRFESPDLQKCRYVSEMCLDSPVDEPL